MTSVYAVAHIMVSLREDVTIYNGVGFLALFRP